MKRTLELFFSIKKEKFLSKIKIIQKSKFSNERNILSPDILLNEVKNTFDTINYDYETEIMSFQHIKNIELRNKGKKFTFEEHLSGVIFSLLSNQRPWGPIEANRKQIVKIFYNFEKEKIL